MLKKIIITIISTFLLDVVLLYINGGYNTCGNYSKCIDWGIQIDDNIHQHPGPCRFN